MYWKGKHLKTGWGAYSAFGVHTCFDMIQKEEKARGKAYSFVVKSRHDSHFKGKLPTYPDNWPKAQQKQTPTAWVPSTGNCLASGFTGGGLDQRACVHDHFAVLTGGEAMKAYLFGQWFDYSEALNVTTALRGDCPECYLGAGLSQRGVYKQILTDFEPEKLWRYDYGPQLTSASESFLDDLFGGAPDFPLVGSCKEQKCAEELCKPDLFHYGDGRTYRKEIRDFCIDLAMEIKAVMELKQENLGHAKQCYLKPKNWNHKKQIATMGECSDIGKRHEWVELGK